MADTEVKNDDDKVIEFLTPIPEVTDPSHITRRVKTSPAKDKQPKVVPLPDQQSVEELTPDISNLRIPEEATSGGTSPIPMEEIVRKQKKVKKLLTNCDKLDNSVDNIINNLKNQTKDYDIQVDISKDPLLKMAVRKIFKKSYKYIDKRMYLYAIDRLLELQNKRLEDSIEDG